VINSIQRLPLEIPAQFHNTYTPVAAAGTEEQVGPTNLTNQNHMYLSFYLDGGQTVA